MKIVPTAIPGVLIVEPLISETGHGWFLESFNAQWFHDAMSAYGYSAPLTFVQDNHSCSHKGVLRGLHFQLSPHAQGKIVRVVSGRAWDVAVDIRSDSPTYGKWVGFELNAENRRMLWIPPGFAHGFLALEDNTHFLYKTTEYYAQESERAIRWNDPDLNIHWPVMDPILNKKDSNAPSFSEMQPLLQSTTWS